MCREGAWAELTVEVTPVARIQSKALGLNMPNLPPFLPDSYLISQTILKSFLIIGISVTVPFTASSPEPLTNPLYKKGQSV